MSNQLTHYGVKGMKWGIRRYQNKNGTLTAAGKNRYSDADKARRRQTAKKVAVGAAAVLTVAAAATIYAKNKKQIDAFVARNAMKVIVDVADAKVVRDAKKMDREWRFVKNNKKRILNSPTLLTRYRDYFDESEVEKATKHYQQTRELHGMAQNEIRRGANYIQAVLTYGTAVTAAYNLKNSQLAKDMKKNKKKKKED